MFVTFKFAYQNWHTMDQAAVAAEVVKGAINADEYQTIVGEAYVTPTAE